MLTGYTALVQDLDLNVPMPHTESRIVGAVRRSEIHADRAFETFPKQHLHAGDVRGHLLFALKNEPTDLRVLSAAFKALGPHEVRAWVQDEPTGAYSRRAFFLYEYLTGETLDLPDAKTGKYAEVLDPKRHVVGPRFVSKRHRIADNLLGVPGFCPTVRRTQKLKARMSEALDKEAAALVANVEPELLRRAVSYLFTKETRSTFEIEGEKANPKREERFVAALTKAAEFEPAKSSDLISLQNIIVEPRYAATEWRKMQNFVGETVSGYREVVHLICPKPEDVPSLMSAWGDVAGRLIASDTDAVIAAAALSFGFVFIHPFEDGNGRIHRFLIHNILARRGFSPKDVIFPVSVAIVRDMKAYDTALETFSKPLLSLVDWEMVNDELVVKGDTVDHYRYFDATPLAEYLYDRVGETVHRDLAQELDFLGCFDRAYRGARDVVDMPNKKLSLFVRLVMGNNGHLAKARRAQFAELTDAELAAMEAAVRAAREGEPAEE